LNPFDLKKLTIARKPPVDFTTERSGFASIFLNSSDKGVSLAFPSINGFALSSFLINEMRCI